MSTSESSHSSMSSMSSSMTSSSSMGASNSSSSTSESHGSSQHVLSTLSLPSNATSIRPDITDNFTCKDKIYGYYADVENECQVFHVCLPVTYPDGKAKTFRWSFVCPEETIFSQVRKKLLHDVFVILIYDIF